jgi:hypothetical protein
MKKFSLTKLFSMGFTVVILTIAGVIWLQIALAAWQGPSADPPGDNVLAPLNVGPDLQVKSGGLDIAELYFDGSRAEIDFDSAGPALIFDATNNGDWDILLYESGLYIGNGENLYMGGGAIYDVNDAIVNIGENLKANGYVKGDSLCIGSDCRTNWPAGGVGDITGVYSGEGTKGGSSSGNATIEFDCSEVASTGLSCSGENIRVKNTSFSCNSGYSLRSIDINTGAKTCEKDDIGGSSGCSNTYRYVQADSGKATASGCSDTLGIRGGTGISTSRSGDNIYINASGVSTPSLSCTNRWVTCNNTTHCNNASVCYSNELVTGGGCYHSNNNYSLFISASNGSRGWRCDYHCTDSNCSSPGNTSIDAICCKIQ